MQLKKMLLKSTIGVILLLQPIVQANPGSYLMDYCSYAWQNHKYAIGVSVSLVSAAALAYRFREYFKMGSLVTFGSNGISSNRRSSIQDPVNPLTINREAVFTHPEFSLKNLSGKVIIKGSRENKIKIVAIKTSPCSVAQGNTDIFFSGTSYSCIGSRIIPNYQTCECATGDFYNSVHFSSVAFEVSLPRATNVNIGTSNGSIAITDCGNVQAATSNGHLKIDRCGIVEACTSNGSITCDACTRIMKARTSNGSITCSACPQVNDAHTSNGRITLTNAQNAVNITTSNGQITFNRCENISRVRTSNGKIVVDGNNQGCVIR